MAIEYVKTECGLECKLDKNEIENIKNLNYRCLELEKLAIKYNLNVKLFFYSSIINNKIYIMDYIQINVNGLKIKGDLFDIENDEIELYCY